MDVNDYLYYINDLSNIVVSIYDSDSEKVVLNTSEEETDSYPLDAIAEAGLDGYDVESVDISLDGGKIHIEINISMGEPED